MTRPFGTRLTRHGHENHRPAAAAGARRHERTWPAATTAEPASAVATLLAAAVLSLLVAFGIPGMMPVPGRAAGAGSELVPAGGPGLDLWNAVQAALAVSAELRLAELQVLEAELALVAAEVERGPGDPEYLEAEQALRDAQDAWHKSAASVALRAEESFYAVLRAGDLYELRRRAAEQAQTQAAVAQARFEAGMISLLDRLEIELASKTAAARLVDAERELAGARLALAELTGLSPLPELLRPETLGPAAPGTTAISIPVPQVDLEAATASALHLHSDMASARAALQAAERRLELARLSGAAPVAIRRAEIDVERARIRLADTEARIRQDVRQGYDALVSAAREVALKEEALALAERRLEIAKTRYDAGAASLIDLSAAESRAMEARLDAASALWEYNLRHARFLRLIGEAGPIALPVPGRTGSRP